MNIRLTLLSLMVVSSASTTFADVRGMSSNQLAQWAQSQNNRDAYRASSNSQAVHPVSYQSAPAVGSSSHTAQMQRDALDDLLTVYEKSAPATPQYSVRNYGKSAPKLKVDHIQKVEAASQPTQSKAIQAQESNVVIKGTPTVYTEQRQSVSSGSDDSENWMSKVASYNSDLIREEKRLAQSKPSSYTVKTDYSQPELPRYSNNVQVHRVSLSNSYPMQQRQTGRIIAAPLNKAPKHGNTDFYAMKPASIDCVVDVADAYGVPTHVLLGIASQERGKNGQKVRNSNGSYDLGHFQINTIHFGKNGVFSHINREDAKWRGCYNAELAAWLLRKQLQRTDLSNDFWTRVAGYHSWTPKHNIKYRASVRKYSEDWKVWLSKRSMQTY